MPAKKTAKSSQAGKAAKKAPAQKKGAKKIKMHKSSGTCSVCSAGIKPMAKCDNCSPKAMLHEQIDEPVVEPLPEPIMPGPEKALSCSRCDHIPGRVSVVIGLLAVVIVVLSITVLASVMIISSQAFQIEAYNSSGGYIDNVARK